MIAPLVWVTPADGRGFIAVSVVGQYAVFDEDDPRWAFSRRGGYTYYYVNTLKEAKAAANTHHRTAIMTAFTGEAT
jgi:hypothetical protein